MDLIHRIREKMKLDRLMFVYRGVVTSENSVPLLMLLEKEMQDSEFGFVGRKKLFMFVLESLQNVSRHGGQSLHSDMSMVVYSKTDEGYTVITGNTIDSSSAEELKSRLDEINSLEPGEIRNVYRQMLNTAEFSEKGGAGLGLIEMARKTGNKLDYDFIPIDSQSSYFVLSKTVDAGGTGGHFSKQNGNFSGRSVASMEEIMDANNVHLIWMGHITPDVGKEVLTFAETRLVEEDVEANLRKRIFSILVEALENVEKYSPGKEAEDKFGLPMAMLRTQGNEYILTTGNLILNREIALLKEKIDEVNLYDRAGLGNLFRESLHGQTLETDSTGNMGLIDMARKSNNKLVYEFEPLNDFYSYYLLTVRIEDRIS